MLTATEVFEEVQVVNGFIFACVPSLKVPTAVNSCAEAGAICALEGVTAIDESVADVTVTAALPLALVPAKEKAALTVAFPALMPVVKPAGPGKFCTVATAVLLELHVTCEVRFCCEESLKTPVAVKFL